MPSGDRDRAILERLRQVCAYAYDHAPFYRRKWDAAGFHPAQLKSLEDFESRVPVVTKEDLREIAGCHAAVRRLPVHPGQRGLPRARHQRNDRPPDGVCARAQRLAHDRQRARPHHVGHGDAARRH